MKKAKAIISLKRVAGQGALLAHSCAWESLVGPGYPAFGTTQESRRRATDRVAAQMRRRGSDIEYMSDTAPTRQWRAFFLLGLS